MLVSVSGYNFSGSGAVIDLLKEYQEITCVDPEIAFVYLPDGIIDLDYHINAAPTYLNGDAAISRYWNLCKKSAVPQKYRKAFNQITQEYLYAIVDETWQGNSSFEGTRKTGSSYLVWYLKKIYSILLFHYFKKISSASNHTMYLSHHCRNFNTATEDYLNRVVDLFAGNSEKRIVVMNQFFSAYQPEKSMKYMQDAKTIVVDRDPRDIYILGKIKRRTQCYPVDDAKKFIKYFRTCWENRSNNNSDKVLHVQFEDVIYAYEDSVKQIEDFLGIHNHVSPKKYLKPEVSINNTQLKGRYPELSDDIAFIEKNLQEYLYPFPSKIQPTGDYF